MGGPVIGKWMTLEEVMDEFHVAERTFYRWRKRHRIRAGHLTRRHPIMFHRDDVVEAEYQENVAGKSRP
jgi:predicted site-specific integrase-resolvase